MAVTQPPPNMKICIHFHGKPSWPNDISATPDHENRMCFHGKKTAIGLFTTHHTKASMAG
ncbi:hypothetical protein MTBBW1_1670014 [Desulfamplus magnetovallimortis]|uniref:Uncharacterized protein n=1 Tax=Desulfamplus magnetovallimortis TaxID=1246637 RepID=A0A1W1H9F7_9BACT|nr:hypothetical protein MTBBW1_1670014 [Desulfamplus magnetovallimortis]